MDSLPCIVCGEVLRDTEVSEEHNVIPYDGITFEGHGNYGSRLFDPLDGSYLIMVLCDSCAKERGDRIIHIAYKRNVPVVHMKRKFSETVDRLGEDGYYEI